MPRHLLPCTICIFTQACTYILTLYIEVCVTLVYAHLTALQESIGGYKNLLYMRFKNLLAVTCNLGV